MITKPLAALVVLALSVVAAGCGASSSSSSNATPATTTTAPATSGQAAGSSGGRRTFPVAFTTCLKQHGVSLPTGGFGRPPQGTGTRQAGVPSANRPAATPEQAKQRAAFVACRKFAPQGFGRGFGRRGGGGQFARYTACMRKQGITLGGAGARVDLTSPKFKAAAKKCRSLLPASASGSGAPGPGGTGQ